MHTLQKEPKMFTLRIPRLRRRHILTRPAHPLHSIPPRILPRHLRPQPQHNHHAQHLQCRARYQRMLILWGIRCQKDVGADKTSRIRRERQCASPESPTILAAVVVVVPGVEHGCRNEGAHFDEETGKVAGGAAVERYCGEDHAADKGGAEGASEEDGALAVAVREPGVEVEPERGDDVAGNGQANGESARINFRFRVQ